MKRLSTACAIIALYLAGLTPVSAAAASVPGPEVSPLPGVESPAPASPTAETPVKSDELASPVAPDSQLPASEVPLPEKTPPPPDLDERAAEAIEEQALNLEALQRTPGAFEPEPVPFTPGPSLGPRTVQCFGDSILGSVCGPGADGIAPLGVALPNWTTINRPGGGQWSTSIAVTAGAYRMQLVDPVMIAASGETTLPTPFMFEFPADEMGGLTMQVAIAGVEGTLVHRTDLGISWRFTRTTPGDPVAVEPGTPIVSLGAMAPGASSVIWVGTNNLTATEQILRDIAAMVELHRSVSDQPFWIASVTPAWGNSASVYGIARAELNTVLEATYGEQYIPIDEYLGNGALTDSGLVPSTADRSWIAMGLNPPSFHSTADWVHFNRIGQGAIARFIARFVEDGTSATQQRRLFDAEAAMRVDLSGSTVSVYGWAFDRSDLYERIPVGITIDGSWMGATFADRPSPELAPFGVPGGHGFAWSKTVPEGGPHEICIVGVGIGVGANAYPPCATVIVRDLLPQGDMSLVDVGDGTMAIMGWGFDHADLYASISVAIIIDGQWHGGVTASLPSPYLYPYGVPGSHAFFRGAKVGKGAHSVCAVGVSAVTNRSAILKCESVILR